MTIDEQRFLDAAAIAAMAAYNAHTLPMSYDDTSREAYRQAKSMLAERDRMTGEINTERQEEYHSNRKTS